MLSCRHDSRISRQQRRKRTNHLCQGRERRRKKEGRGARCLRSERRRQYARPYFLSLFSTPFRHEAPSLHDELVAQEDLTNRASLSPLVGMEEPQSLDSLLDMSENSSLVEGAGDEFSRILQQAVSGGVKEGCGGERKEDVCMIQC